MYDLKLLREMDSALQAARQCSAELEALFAQYNAIGYPTPELIEKTRIANEAFARNMKRHTDCYERYLGVIH